MVYKGAMTEKMEKRPKPFGESLPDRIADFAQRWWWVVSAASLPGFMAWAKSLELGRELIKLVSTPAGLS